MKVNLSNVSVDFETLLEELKLDLRTKQTWKDLLVSSTGTAILEYIAAIGTFNQFNIELSYRESVMHLAVRDSSIYGIARTLGINVPRKMSATVTANLVNDSGKKLIIPSKSKFIGNSAEFFCVTQLTMEAGQRATVFLREGVTKTKTFPVSTIKYHEYLLGEPGFSVTSDDLRVSIIDNDTGIQELWTKTESALWTHNAYDKVYYETTSPTGDVSIIFGDGNFGSNPSVNSTIVVEYVTTTGESANFNMINLQIFYSQNSNLTGNIVDYYSFGSSEKSSEYYKLYAPHIFKARDRAVSATDYVSIILSHPDVADVVVLGQRDLYTNDPRWMNTVRICVLTTGSVDSFGGVNPNPISAKWDQFLKWFQPKTGWITIQTWNPTKVYVDVNVDIALRQSANRDVVEATVRENVTKLFYKDMYTLGKTLYLSDISDACKISDVDYITINAPTTNVKPDDIYTFLALNRLVLTLFYSERTSLPNYRS